MLATRPVDEAKQICLYAMMCQYRLIWDFMITVVGEKYKKFDTSFGNMDLNVFFMQLQEQDDWVATWADSTVYKLKQVIKKIQPVRLNGGWLPRQRRAQNLWSIVGSVGRS